jgi:hypothetical protein
MSQAFVRESDDQWLSDVGPSLTALIVFLTGDNNGVRVYEISSTSDKDGRIIHSMSNGLRYSKNTNSQWFVVDQDIPSA